jgi:hypothetical protein
MEINIERTRYNQRGGVSGVRGYQVYRQRPMFSTYRAQMKISAMIFLLGFSVLVSIFLFSLCTCSLLNITTLKNLYVAAYTKTYRVRQI